MVSTAGPLLPLQSTPQLSSVDALWKYNLLLFIVDNLMTMFQQHNYKHGMGLAYRCTLK
jgi:hypothetical protein